jgi:hypothetical protein
MQTSIRVEEATRDELARIARELGGVSLDEALRVVLFRHRTMQAVERLAADPAALADYRAEAHDLAEADVSVRDR